MITMTIWKLQHQSFYRIQKREKKQLKGSTSICTKYLLSIFKYNSKVFSPGSIDNRTLPQNFEQKCKIIQVNTNATGFREVSKKISSYTKPSASKTKNVLKAPI